MLAITKELTDKLLTHNLKLLMTMEVDGREVIVAKPIATVSHNATRATKAINPICIDCDVNSNGQCSIAEQPASTLQHCPIDKW